jgi:hypothetical protein
MAAPLIYIDTSRVHEGALPRLQDAIADLAEFVEQNEPRIVSYSVYFSEAGDRMSVTHIHSDAASLDYHIEVAGPRFAPFAELLTLQSIHVYGEPTEWAVEQLRRKVEMLGTGEVVVHPAHAGFGRFVTTAAPPDQGR